MSVILTGNNLTFEQLRDVALRGETVSLHPAAIERMNAAPLNVDGTATAQLEPETTRVKLVVMLELVGFLVIFTCMILMRFGI